MQPREKFLAALERRPISGRVPHFELVFFLTMEAFGRLVSHQRCYDQWDQMSVTEQTLHIRDVAELHLLTAERFEHSAIVFHVPRGWDEEAARRGLEHIRELSGDRFALFIDNDATLSLPGGDGVMELTVRMFEDAEGLKRESALQVERALRRAERLKSWGVLDGFTFCSDYCFNTNPFFSPEQFDDFVFPYLKELTQGCRELGFYVIKHTDGNIMPILDRLAASGPHALHSLDPQGGVDIAEVKRRVGDQLCLIGNVSCAELQTGTLADVEHSVRYALESGMPGYGYIFSTSNCVYTGMELARYEYMLELWRRYGNYPDYLS